jgi:hypothetical protein
MLNGLLTLLGQLLPSRPWWVRRIRRGNEAMPHTQPRIAPVPSAPHHASAMGHTAAERADSLIAASCRRRARRQPCLFRSRRGVSTGSYGADCDLVEAHKWFNLAAVAGHDDAARARADVAEEMTAREIAEAQRRAREWLRSAARRAA